MAKKESYNDMLENLEDILRNLENSELTLEESMKEYEKGSKLINKLYKTLNTLEGKFINIKEENDGIFKFKVEKKGVKNKAASTAEIANPDACEYEKTEKSL